MNAPLFNPKAVAALQSPDDLEKAIRVTNPGIWMILAACAALLLGLLSWGLFGTFTSHIGATGIVKDGRIMCLLDIDEVHAVHTGQKVMIDQIPVTVDSIADIPISRNEALSILESDYLVSVNMTGDWGVMMTLVPETAGAFPEGKMVSFNLAADKVAPISLIWDGLTK